MFILCFFYIIGRHTNKKLIFEEKKVIDILYKEVIYSGLRGDESYVAFCLSRPLEGGGQVPLFDDGSEVFAEDRIAEDWEIILFSDYLTRKQLEELETRIIVMKDPLELVTNKREPRAYVEIRQFAEKMCREVIREEKFAQANVNPKFRMILQTAFESCGTVATHGTVFAALADYYTSAEHDVQTRLHDLRQLILVNKSVSDRSGLTNSFLQRFGESQQLSSSAFLRSVDDLQTLNAKKSPLEKLWCLRDANRALRDMPGNDNMDDSLPLFLLALISAAPGLLLANLAFMSDFAPRLWVKSAGELSFHCTVFSGAVTLIQEHIPAQEEEQSLLRNLIVAGGSGLGVSWIGGAAGTRTAAATTTTTNKRSSSSSTFPSFFDSCTPQSRN